MSNTTKIALEASLKELLKKKPFIMNVYHSVRREKIESFLYKLTYQLIADVVEEKCARDHLPEEDKQFIADFYKYGFVGIMLDWIDRGKKEDYKKGEVIKFLSFRLFCKLENDFGQAKIETSKNKTVILLQQQRENEQNITEKLQ